MRAFFSLTGRLGIVGVAALALLAAPITADESQSAGETEAQAASPARFASRIERDQYLLAQAFPDEARRVAIPHEETQSDLLILYKAALHAEPKGTVLMAHSADKPGDWPRAWENVRRALPYYGWATLALTLPTPPPAEIPPRPDGARAQSEGDQEETNDDASDAGEISGPEPQSNLSRAQRIGMRLDAALAELPSGADQNLVLLVDNVSAPDVLAHIQPQLRLAEPDTPQGQSPLARTGRALILANLYPEQPLSRTQLQTLFSIPKLPILDLFPSPDSERSRRQRKLHRGLAQQQNLARYQSLLMPPAVTADVNDHSSYWVRRLSTFMTHQNSSASLVQNAPD